MSQGAPEKDWSLEVLLNRLAESANARGPAPPGATPPAPAPVPKNRGIEAPLRDEELTSPQAISPAGPPPAAPKSAGSFTPLAPHSLVEARLEPGEVEELLLKSLMYRGTASGLEISKRIALPFASIEPLLHGLKAARWVVFKGPASLGDYVYELTEAGLHRAREFAERCSYAGTAPVQLGDYQASVMAQTLQSVKPSMADLRRAFTDLSLTNEMFFRVARAVFSGKGLFLHGRPGNGKTSIAERISRAYGSSIWIPRSICVGGEIIQLYDPSCHEALPTMSSDRMVNSEKVDDRWVRIRRPTIVAGGELTLSELEITQSNVMGVSEAPLQLKSNCGVLVIDDFGRQQIAPAALLNRWIVPLEKRYDYLNLPSGCKIQVPFEQFVVFSTNLEPRDLVDEAFLRRIPYKIDVTNPDEKQFRRLFGEIAKKQGLAVQPEMLDYLISEYYVKTGREFRYCHPRDLLHQIGVYFEVLQVPPQLTKEAIDAATADYFSVL